MLFLPESYNKHLSTGIGLVSLVQVYCALTDQAALSAFDLDTVKLLMTLFDTDRSGTVGFQEFAGLWKYIKDWQGVCPH